MNEVSLYAASMIAAWDAKNFWWPRGLEIDAFARAIWWSLEGGRFPMSEIPL